MKTICVTLCCCVALAVPAYADQVNDGLSKTPPACEYGQPNPAANAAFSQFSFLIGDFSVQAQGWFQGAWRSRPGAEPSRWNGRYGLGGMAIIDEWFNVDPDKDPHSPRGINVRIFDEAAGEWKMMWIATGTKIVQDLRAKLIDDQLTMWQVHPERQDFKAIFEVVDENHWHRIHYGKNDAGQWVRQVKLVATRIGC